MVKDRASVANGSMWPSHLISCTSTQDKTSVMQNSLCRNLWEVLKKWKGKLKTLQTQSLFNHAYPVDLLILFEPL